MFRNFNGGKRKRTSQYTGVHDAEDGALVLSGDAAQVDYEENVPTWKQEVTDAQGRKRLHGAFTGGYSAGYFNTVGSKEGWTPSTFVSSRTARHKAVEKTVLDYMDDEDLAEIEDDRQLRLRQEKQAREEDQEGQTSAHEEHRAAKVPRAQDDSESSEARKQMTVITKSTMTSLPSARGGAKALSLLDDEDDIDGFDIGPKIKYDKSLAKKKKAGATMQHTFTRKVVRNPDPEPEVFRRPSDSPNRSNAVRSAQDEQRLLPSIGDQNEQVAPSSAKTSEASLINPARLAQMSQPAAPLDTDVNNLVRTDPVPPWRQQTTSSEAKIPPWRRSESIKAQIPSIGRQVALLALQSTFTPYPQDSEKHSRYRRYLEIEATGQENEQHRQGDLDPDTWIAECDEFKKCALMYKPMTGAMNQKFTSTTTSATSTEGQNQNEAGGIWENSISSQVKAARQGRFGHMTRITGPWTPSRLLCKRFNVIQVSEARQKDRAGRGGEPETRASEINKLAVEELMRSAK